MSKKRNKGFPADIREQLGLTQTELAEYLEVSQAMIAMSEAHEREITGDAHVELIKLTMMYDGDTSVDEFGDVREFQDQEKEQRRPALEKDLDKFKYQWELKQRAYEQARTAREALLRRMHAFGRAIEHLDHPPKAELHDYWRMGHLDRARKEEFFKEKQQDIREKLKKYDTYIMAMKKADLLALEAKVAYLEGGIL